MKIQYNKNIYKKEQDIKLKLQKMFFSLYSFVNEH